MADVSAEAEVHNASKAASAEREATDTDEPKEAKAEATDTADTDSAQAEPAEKARRKRPSGKVLTASVAFLLVLAAAVFFGINYFLNQATNSDRDQAVTVAKQYAIDTATYDYHNLNTNFDFVKNHATTNFGPQYKQITDQLTKLLQQSQATSKATVTDVGIESFDGTKAQMLIFLNQNVTNTTQKGPQRTPYRMRMTLLKQNDDWKIDGFSFVL